MGWMDGQWSSKSIFGAKKREKYTKNISTKVDRSKKEFPAVMSGCKPRPLCGGSMCAKSTKFAHIKSCLYCQNKTRNSLQHWAYKQGQVCEGGGGVADFPAVFFHIAHWYLS